MRTSRVLIWLALAAAAGGVFGGQVKSITAKGEPRPSSPPVTDELLRLAASSDANAVAALRNSGQAGLDAVLAANARSVEAMRTGATPLDDANVMELRTRIDAVARQRDAFASGLYWYTDLEAAKAQAARSGRHILSLRLLGNLDEEYSCANSRFFRTVLYANAEVSKHLREHYVLHWKSVRPAPLVTIDMGDGRRIKRTITGNSIHYILDSDGTVLDALPGLYGPRPFLAALKQSENLSAHNAAALRDWHASQAGALQRQWLADAVQIGMYGEEFATRMKRGRAGDIAQCMAEAFPSRLVPPTDQDDAVPPSKQSSQPKSGRKPTEFEPNAMAKSMVERPISRRTQAVQSQTNAPPPASPADPANKPLADRMTGEWWQKLGALRLNDARLDESSRRLMMAKLPRDGVRADERASGGVMDGQTPFARTLGRFEGAIAEDTVRNEYAFHVQIHRWLAADKGGQLSGDVERLNKHVYAVLFLTPDYDAWLGLVPDDTYTALEKDGCACDKGAPPMK
ncbi:MAG TPA: hypothetical protein VG269_16500 [Tepidisphaeraceae bacterium]|jgi:hypothetical protein|nr:hypothetical protein [Tepidisphaeraceae bacterium]